MGICCCKHRALPEKGDARRDSLLSQDSTIDASAEVIDIIYGFSSKAVSVATTPELLTLELPLSVVADNRIPIEIDEQERSNDSVERCDSAGSINDDYSINSNESDYGTPRTT